MELAKKGVGLGGLGKAKDAIRGLKNDDRTAIDVPLDLIDFDESQYRRDKSRYDIPKLARSIRAQGLIKFPTYEKQENGRYLVNTGEMRTRAYMWLRENYPDEPQWNAIPARIKAIPTIEGLTYKASRLIYQFVENELHEKPTLFDRAEGLADIFAEGGKEAVKHVLSSKGLKDSDAEVSKWKGVAKANALIRQDVIEGEITDKETIITLSKIADEDPTRYESIIQKFKSKELDRSIAQTAKSEWAKLKEKKAGKAAKKTTGEKKSNQKESSGTAPAKSNMEFSAKDLSFENGVLTIDTRNGFQMKFTGLEHLDVVIGKAKK
ncbi:ParB/RepB/Spo0J family partition protein [Alteromonas australica]|nr:ParB N-terminal domain-containing protein [Alteromonas australica]|tara:strand:+ start:38476 stop:39441 length:966 start_codon:yes stop_codon:yes gene_type:complete